MAGPVEEEGIPEDRRRGIWNRFLNVDASTRDGSNHCRRINRRRVDPKAPFHAREVPVLADLAEIRLDSPREQPHVKIVRHTILLYVRNLIVDPDTDDAIQRVIGERPERIGHLVRGGIGARARLADGGSYRTINRRLRRWWQ